ncbi:hypothetical protein [Flagellimonas sp.]|uniref:hypothetical protein n=1 Tax=Flagellimonas sp. TaxID=2058762 RepID=UPI003BA9582D
MVYHGPSLPDRAKTITATSSNISMVGFFIQWGNHHPIDGKCSPQPNVASNGFPENRVSQREPTTILRYGRQPFCRQAGSQNPFGHKLHPKGMASTGRLIPHWEANPSGGSR